MQTSVRSAVVEGPAQLFAGILQPDDIRTEESERRAASSDIYGAGTTVDAVLQPRDARQLAAAVAAATRAGYAVVTRGGGMSYTGGYLAERPGTVLVDTLHLDRIVEISAEDLYITVEAGVTWKRIHEALAPLGLRLPFFGTFSGARATVGGGLSNGALFLGTARFGTAADCMLGMEVVLVDGTLLRTGQRALRRARKPFYRTYGPDLSGLFIHDSGALGIKVQATFRLIRTPAHTGYASFVFDGMEAAGAALSEVARTGAAEEAYVFDPETTRKNLAGGNLSRDARTLLNVVRGESSLLKGVREGARLVAAGRDFMPADAYSLHVVCTGRSEAALEAELAACRTACESLGGREIVDSIPRAVRANLFPAPDGVLERLTAEGGGVDRALAPGGLVDQLLDENGLVERVLAEDGLADRLFAEGGVIDRLTAKDGPLEQLTVVTDSLNRLAPGMEALTPTVEALRDAVIAMTKVVDPLSNIAERIPLPGRRLWPFRDEEA